MVKLLGVLRLVIAGILMVSAWLFYTEARSGQVIIVDKDYALVFLSLGVIFTIDGLDDLFNGKEEERKVCSKKGNHPRD